MVRPAKPPRKPANNNVSIRKTRKSLAPKVKSTTREVRALKEVKYFMKTWHTLIPKSPFQRLVKEVIQKIVTDRNEMRMQSMALQALQEAAEMYLVQLFEDAVLASVHAKRKTMKVDDMYLVRRVRGRGDVCGHRINWDA